MRTRRVTNWSVENEAQKILGKLSLNSTAFEDQAGLSIGATCTRVAVTDGHMIFLAIRFQNRDNVPTVEHVKQAMRECVSEAQKLGCISAPEEAIVVFDEPDRPQPRLDRDISGVYTIGVGCVREAAKGMYFDLRLAALSHNTVTRADGSSTLNAEGAILKGII